MLTATYSTSVLTAERQKARHTLLRMHECISDCSCLTETAATCGILKSAFEQLVEFDTALSSRKIDSYLVPAIRKIALDDFKYVLDEIACIDVHAKGVLRALDQRLNEAAGSDTFPLDEILVLMLAYCRCQLQRLDKEELSLLPLAWRLLSEQTWFEIGSSCLSENSLFRSRQKKDKGKFPGEMVCGLGQESSALSAMAPVAEGFLAQ